MDIDPTIEKFMERARIARLATANSESPPHLVPVVFVFDGSHFFIPIDEKRETITPEKLKRVTNINENSERYAHVSIALDFITKLSAEENPLSRWA